MTKNYKKSEQEIINSLFSSDILKNKQLFEVYFNDIYGVNDKIKSSEFTIKENIKKHQNITQQMVVHKGIQSEQTLIQITKLSKFLNCMVQFLLKQNQLKQAQQYALTAKQFTEPQGPNSHWKVKFSWQCSRIEILYNFSKIYKNNNQLIEANQFLIKVSIILQQVEEFQKIDKSSMHIISYSGLELIYLIISKNFLKLKNVNLIQKYYQSVEYSIKSINLINSLIKNFHLVVQRDVLDILTQNINFILAKKRQNPIFRYFLLKSYNIIGQCLEYVYQTNLSLIDEDRFILHREICNYFILCLEICKLIMGPSDKMVIFFKEKVNYIQYQREEQELLKKNDKTSQDLKNIQKPKFTNSKIIVKKKPKQQQQTTFNDQFFFQGMISIQKSHDIKKNQIEDKQIEKNTQFFRYSLQIIDKFIEPILKPDRLLRGKWVPSIMNITPNELIYKKRYLFNIRFEYQDQSQNLNFQLQLPDKNKKLQLIQTNLSIQSRQIDLKIAQNSVQTSRFESLKNKINPSDFTTTDDSSNIQLHDRQLISRPQTSRLRIKQNQESIEDKNQAQVFKKSKMKRKASLIIQVEKIQGFLKKQMKNKRMALRGINQGTKMASYINDNNQDESVDKLIYIFENYEEINKNHRQKLQEKAQQMIKTVFCQKLKRIREKISYGQSLQGLKLFVTKIVSSYEKLDKSLTDSSGLKNEVTNFFKHTDIKSHKNQNYINNYENFVDYKFFDFQIFIKINNQQLQYHIKNFHILQKNFMSYLLTFQIQTNLGQLAIFSYEFNEEIPSRELNEINGVFEISLANYILDKFIKDKYDIEEDDLMSIQKRIYESSQKKSINIIDILEQGIKNNYILIKNSIPGYMDNFSYKDHFNLENMSCKMELIISGMLCIKNKVIYLDQALFQHQNVIKLKIEREKQDEGIQKIGRTKTIIDQFNKNQTQDKKVNLSKSQKLDKLKDMQKTANINSILEKMRMVKKKASKKISQIKQLEYQQDVIRKLENFVDKNSYKEKQLNFLKQIHKNFDVMIAEFDLCFTIYNKQLRKYEMLQVSFENEEIQVLNRKITQSDRNLQLEKQLCNKFILKRSKIYQYFNYLINDPLKIPSQLYELKNNYVSIQSKLKKDQKKLKNILLFFKLIYKENLKKIRHKKIHLFINHQYDELCFYDSHYQKIRKYKSNKQLHNSTSLINKRQIFFFGTKKNINLSQLNNKFLQNQFCDYNNFQVKQNNEYIDDFFFNCEQDILFRRDIYLKNYFTIQQLSFKYKYFNIFQQFQISIYFPFINEYYKQNNPIIKIVMRSFTSRVKLSKIIFHFNEIKYFCDQQKFPENLEKFILFSQQQIISRIFLVKSRIYSKFVIKPTSTYTNDNICQNFKNQKFLLQNELIYLEVIKKYFVLIDRVKFFLQICYQKYLNSYQILLYCIRSQREFQVQIEKHEFDQIKQDNTIDQLINMIKVTQQENQNFIQIKQFKKNLHDFVFDQIIKIEGENYYAIAQLQILTDNLHLNDHIQNLNYYNGTNYQIIIKIISINDGKQLSFKQSLRQLIVLFYRNQNYTENDIQSKSIFYSDIYYISEHYLKQLIEHKFDEFFFKDKQIFIEYANLKVNQTQDQNIYFDLPLNMKLSFFQTNIEQVNEFKLITCQIIYRKLLGIDRIISLFYDPIMQLIYFCQDLFKERKRQILTIQIKQVVEQIPYFMQMQQNLMLNQCGKLVYNYILQNHDIKINRFKQF